MYHTCIRTPFLPPFHPHIREEGRRIQSSISGKLERHGERRLFLSQWARFPRSRGVRVSYQLIYIPLGLPVSIYLSSLVRSSACPTHSSDERSSRSHIDQTLTGNTAYFPLQQAHTPAIRRRMSQGCYAMLYIICVYLLTLKRPANKSVGAFPRFTFHNISCFLGI